MIPVEYSFGTIMNKNQQEIEVLFNEYNYKIYDKKNNS